MKDKNYSQITKNNTSNAKIQNKILITKLLQLGPKDWPKFINGIIPILSTNVIHTRFLSKGGAKPGEDRKYK